MIAGRCSFFVASGYLVFQLNVPPGAEYATSKIFSGTINMAQSTGSVFLAGGEELARGEVTLAGRSLQLVHGEPGTLAAWPNGYVLEVGGSPAGTP